jgi:dihydroorotate dehydrogenase (fumarate)
MNNWPPLQPSGTAARGVVAASGACRKEEVMSMDLTTTYLGLNLKTPLVPSACGPLSNSLGAVRALEDAGASAIIMYSLFEEEILHESQELDHYLTYGSYSHAEALNYFPDPKEFEQGPDRYLEHLYKAKRAVGIPVVGSLSGVSSGGWVKLAKQIEETGADALELNIYYVPTDLDLPGIEVEQMYINVLQDVKRTVKIPVAIKLGAFFSNMAHMAKRLANAGAAGLVLFNRFYQPDIDLEQMEVVPNVLLSTPQAMRLPLRWIAILYGRLQVSLAATSGIHSGEDVIKMLMAGADVTMLCSTLLKNGLGQMRQIEKEMVQWMEEHEYKSVEQMKGRMSHRSRQHPSAFERANYIKALKSYV